MGVAVEVGASGPIGTHVEGALYVVTGVPVGVSKNVGSVTGTNVVTGAVDAVTGMSVDA